LCVVSLFLRLLYIERPNICAFSIRGDLSLVRTAKEHPDGRRADAGAGRDSVHGGLGPDPVLRTPLEPREVVMLWVGMIAAIGLLVYLCVAMFDAENF
jgi:K+-transporting ATPase KdpF subunit